MFQILKTPQDQSMKKFNYFLIIAITLSFSSIELNAFTTSNINSISSEYVDVAIQFLSNGTDLLYSLDNANFQYDELELTASNSTSLTQNNLNILYSICLALVLFNLAAQIKIIVQMIHLFSLFRKKDEVVGLNF